MSSRDRVRSAVQRQPFRSVGFALIERLVVIVIIAILAGLLLPEIRNWPRPVALKKLCYEKN